MNQEVPSAPTLLTSPFHQYHLSVGAKMADFGGWLMPIEYPGGEGGVIAEHKAVRERVGIFDVSHLGKILVEGKGAFSFLNSILTNDLNLIANGGAQYTLLCDQSGGVIDDLIAYRINEERIFLIPNAANCSEVFELLLAKAPSEISIENLHRDFAVIAVQGPKARELLESISILVPEDLSYMSFVEIAPSITLCRTGYTGELGFEIVAPNKEGISFDIWQRLVSALADFDGLVAGLGARDTLRTEMGYALHGHELSPDINPVEAGVSWAVGWKKEHFHGRESLVAIRSHGAARRSVALLAQDRTIPRAGMKVLSGERIVGEITSGTFSPSLKSGIALALVSPEIELGEMVAIDVRGRSGSYRVVKAPFLPSRVH